jgi:protein SCO1/2
MSRRAALGLVLALPGAAALAHAGHRHAPAAAPPAPPAPPPAAAFPVPVGVDFALTDQDGRRRRRADFAGRHVLLFFGYANCDAICSAAIPAMLETLDALGPARRAIDAVMITVDPARDTPAGLRRGLAKYGTGIIGLTGTPAALAPVWRGFHVSVTTVGHDPLGQPIYAHGSFLYLLGQDGAVLTMLPPVLPPERLAAVIGGYIR